MIRPGGRSSTWAKSLRRSPRPSSRVRHKAACTRLVPPRERVGLVAICRVTKREGARARPGQGTGERYCYDHDPALAEERSASAKHGFIGKELREVRELIWEILELAVSEHLPVTVRKRLTEVVQLLQCYPRSVELGMRAAEEPVGSGLDVKGLRAQVLWRIEELEEREHEREEMLAELIPAMEARGYEPGDLQAVLRR